MTVTAIESSASVSDRASMGHLLWFFALVYVVEGLRDRRPPSLAGGLLT
jgi:hypothetical protein